MGKKNVIVVKVYREIEYPKAMLNPHSPIRDAINKAHDDMQNHLNEIINNDHAQIDIKMFNFETREELGYKYRRKELEEPGVGKINIGVAAKALATRDMEAKHGPFNHEQNPGIYVLEPEVRTPEGHLLRDAVLYIRRDIEDEFYNTYETYRQLLNSANNVA